MSCDLIQKSLIMLVFTILINKLVNLSLVSSNNILHRMSNILLLFIANLDFSNTFIIFETETLVISITLAIAFVVLRAAFKGH